MKLSTKGRYGVRLMMDLAAHSGRGPVLLREISKRQEISEKYLWSLIHSLKAVGLVSATRGVHGGYKLTKSPAEITIKEILQASEGPMCLVDCVEKPESCNRVSFCAARDLWGEIAGDIDRILKTTTLSDMVARQNTKKEDLGGDYMI